MFKCMHIFHKFIRRRNIVLIIWEQQNKTWLSVIIEYKISNVCNYKEAKLEYKIVFLLSSYFALSERISFRDQKILIFLEY